MNKICTYCKKNLDIENFPIINSKTNKRSSKCHSCKKEYEKQYWQKIKKNYSKVKNKNRRKIYERNRLYVLNILKNSVCKNCGFNDYRCLEFHHIEQKEKKI